VLAFDNHAGDTREGAAHELRGSGLSVPVVLMPALTLAQGAKPAAKER